MPLSANTTPTDEARMLRSQLHWIDGDKAAFDYLLTEVMNDPTGAPGLLFAFCDFTTRLGLQAAPDYADQLRAQLLAHEARQDNDQ